jgi:23S rRNA (guanine1835-N2)-methyltransferase
VSKYNLLFFKLNGMNTIFTVADKQLQLDRLPLGQSNRSLQAWDAADELLLQQALPLLTTHIFSKTILY